MIKVNLLPPEIVAERSRKATQARLMKMAGMLIIVLMAGVGVQFMLTLQLRGQVHATVNERLAVEAQVAEYVSFVELQSSVNSKNNLVKTAMGYPLKWRDTLAALGVHIPGNVWLSNVFIAHDKEKGNLVLRGFTYDHPSVANWVTILQEIPGISDVRVLFSAEEVMDIEELVRFEIKVTVATDQEFDPLAKRGE